MIGLERGGAAAASILRRLREAEGRIRWAEVSPEAMWICREEDLMVPLLGWAGADAALGVALEGLAGTAGPRLEIDPFLGRRAPVFPGGPAVVRGTGAPGSPSPTGAATTGPQPRADGLRRHVAAILEEAGEPAAREESVPETGTQTRSSPDLASPGWHQPVSPATGFSPGGAVTGPWDEAGGGSDRGPGASVLGPGPESRGGDRRSVEDEPGVRPLQTGMAEPGSGDPFQGTSRGEVPWRRDPVSLRLREVAHRAMTVREAGREDTPFGTRRSSRDNAEEPGAPPSWPPPEEDLPPSERTVVGGPGQSGLRRLASLGETLEPEPTSLESREDATIAPDPWRRPPRALPETRDLAREVADLFRREALRHGILPEEDAP